MCLNTVVLETQCLLELDVLKITYWLQVNYITVRVV